MKIVQVIDQLGLGGAERVCVNLVNLFHRNGYNVKLIVLNKEGELFELVDDGVEVVILNKKEGKFKAYRKFVKEVKGIDIIHVHSRKPYRFVKKAFLFSVKFKSVILHDHYGKIGVDKKIPSFYKTIFKPSVYIGVSKTLTEWAVNTVGLNSKKVFLVSNLIFKYNITTKVFPSKKQGIVLVGNLKPVKNHIFAVKLAKKLDLDVTIYCIRDLNGEYYRKLIREIEEIYDVNRVHFIYNHTNVQEDLHKYDFAICPSLSESGPLVLLEFLAQGIPFLTYNTGEIAHFVKEKFPELVMDDFNIDDWINRAEVLKGYNNEHLSNAFDFYIEKEKFLEKYKEVYKSILNIK